MAPLEGEPRQDVVSNGAIVESENESIPSKSSTKASMRSPKESIKMRRVNSFMTPQREAIVMRRVSSFMGVRSARNHEAARQTIHQKYSYTETPIRRKSIERKMDKQSPSPVPVHSTPTKSNLASNEVKKSESENRGTVQSIKKSKRPKWRWMRTSKSSKKQKSTTLSLRSSPSLTVIQEEPTRDEAKDQASGKASSLPHHSSAIMSPRAESNSSSIFPSIESRPGIAEVIEGSSEQSKASMACLSTSSSQSSTLPLKLSEQTISTEEDQASASTSSPSIVETNSHEACIEEEIPSSKSSFSLFGGSKEENDTTEASCGWLHCNPRNFEAKVERTLFGAIDDACFDKELGLNLSQDTDTVCSFETDFQGGMEKQSRDDDETNPSLVNDYSLSSPPSASSTLAHVRDASFDASTYTAITGVPDDDDSVNTFLSASNQETLRTVGSTLFTRARTLLSMTNKTSGDEALVRTNSLGNERKRGTRKNDFVADSSRFGAATTISASGLRGQVDTVFEEESFGEEDEIQFTSEYIDSLLAGKYH